MGWINNHIIFLSAACFLSSCSIGATSKQWEVTALNGDKMIGCIADDVMPDLQSYYDFSLFPDFSVETFKALEVKYTHNQREITKPAFFDWTNFESVEIIDPQKARRNCDNFSAEKWTRRHRSVRANSYSNTRDVDVVYNLYEYKGKMVFVDAYTFSKTKGLD